MVARKIRHEAGRCSGVGFFIGKPASYCPRTLGYGDVEITDEFRDRKRQEIVSNQKAGFVDKWIEYLSSPDATYPDWGKYWAFRSMLEMGKLEKKQDTEGRETARFQKRTKDTVASFPPLNPRALAMTLDILQSRLTEKKYNRKLNASRFARGKQKHKIERPGIPSLTLDGKFFQTLYPVFDRDAGIFNGSDCRKSGSVNG